MQKSVYFSLFVVAASTAAAAAAIVATAELWSSYFQFDSFY